jgi:hypothetical protein
MTIREILGQGFHYARTCKSLWLFGFFVGMSGGSSGGGRPGGAGGSDGPFPISETAITMIVIAAVVAIIAMTVMRFVSEGALIEGVVRARQGGRMTTGEAFRAGLAHAGVVFRIALLYVAVSVGSLVVLAAPCIIAMQALGPLGAIAVGIPTLLIAVPWLVTIYLVQAFAMRIAVLENRHALDAIAKARLFLHGRLKHALTLIVASFIGTLLIALVGFVVLAPLGLLLFSLVPVLQIVPVIVVGCLVLLPVIYVLTAIAGTLRSSIWTIGYMTQVES